MRRSPRLDGSRPRPGQGCARCLSAGPAAATRPGGRSFTHQRSPRRPLSMIDVAPQAVRAGGPANGLSQFNVNGARPPVGASTGSAAAPDLAHGTHQHSRMASRRTITR